MRDLVARPAGRDRSGDPVIRVALLFGAMVVILRVLYLAWSIHETPVLREPLADSLAYTAWARDLASGHSERWEGAFYRAPLYPYLLGLFYRLHPRPEAAIIVFQGLMGLALTAGVARIAWKLYSPLAGVVAGLLVGLHGPIAAQETKLLPTALGLLLGLAALDRILLAKTWRGQAAGGFCLGLCALVRPSAVTLGFCVLVILFLGLPRSSERARILISFALAMALAISPAVVHNLRAGEPVLIAANGGMTFYHGNNETSVDGLLEPGPRVGLLGNAVEQERLDREAASREAGRALGAAESSSHWFRAGMAFLIANPDRWAALWGEKLLRSLGAHEYADNYSFQVEGSQGLPLRALPVPFPMLLILAAAGLVLRPPRGRHDALLLLFAAAGIITCVVFYVGSRYRCESAAALAVLAGRAVVSWRGAPIFLRLRAAAAVAVLAVPAMVPAGRAGDTQDALAAAQWGGAWERADRPERAVGLYKWATARDPSLAVAWGRWAELETRACGPEAAVAILDLGIASGADGKLLRATRGRLRIALGMHAEALDDLRLAHDADPQDEDVAINLAAVLVRLGRNGDAGRLLERPSLRLDPLASFYRGILELRRGAALQAVEDLRRASAGMPGDPRPALLQAVGLLRADMRSEALSLVAPDSSLAAEVLRFIEGAAGNRRPIPDDLLRAAASSRDLLRPPGMSE